MRNRYKSAIDKTTTEYYSRKVQECGRDQKKLFEIINSLTKPLKWEQYTYFDSLKDLADTFGDFFVMKIKKIGTKLDNPDPDHHNYKGASEKRRYVPFFTTPVTLRDMILKPAGHWIDLYFLLLIHCSLLWGEGERTAAKY